MHRRPARAVGASSLGSEDGEVVGGPPREGAVRAGDVADRLGLVQSFFRAVNASKEEHEAFWCVRMRVVRVRARTIDVDAALYMRTSLAATLSGINSCFRAAREAGSVHAEFVRRSGFFSFFSLILVE